MCIILLAHQAHPDYPLVLAANRDEFYERPTAEAHFWEDGREVLAGRDLERGGTWLGVTKRGRLGAVTNYREPGAKIEGALSRGRLVSRFLLGGVAPAEYLRELRATASLYNGFNLVVGDGEKLFYFSNRADRIEEIGRGVHGVSNHLLDTPWPKVERGRAALASLMAGRRELPLEKIFEVLADDARAGDEVLPETGVGLELERLLSPLFINTPLYGTRSSTVIAFTRNREVIFVERTFSPRREAGYSEVRFDFKIRSDR
jgi:uncharacterized protein with NRDE domain